MPSHETALHSRPYCTTNALCPLVFKCFTCNKSFLYNQFKRGHKTSLILCLLSCPRYCGISNYLLTQLEYHIAVTLLIMQHSYCIIYLVLSRYVLNSRPLRLCTLPLLCMVSYLFSFKGAIRCSPTLL